MQISTNANTRYHSMEKSLRRSFLDFKARVFGPSQPDAPFLSQQKVRR
jgi:hypothetical protein